MIHGLSSMGQHYLASALLNSLEEFSMFSLDYATLNADASAKVIQSFISRLEQTDLSIISKDNRRVLSSSVERSKTEASSCVVHATIPRMVAFVLTQYAKTKLTPSFANRWRMASPAMQLILTSFLQDLDPSLPLFFIMTSDSVVSGDDTSEEGLVMGSFLCSPCEFYEVTSPNQQARKVYSFCLLVSQ